MSTSDQKLNLYTFWDTIQKGFMKKNTVKCSGENCSGQIKRLL